LGGSEQGARTERNQQATRSGEEHEIEAPHKKNRPAREKTKGGPKRGKKNGKDEAPTEKKKGGTQQRDSGQPRGGRAPPQAERNER